MRHVGLDVIPANNSVWAGIQTVASLLKDAPAGNPMLSVHRNSSNLIREFSTYEWSVAQDGSLKDAPKKQHDDCLDSLRYLVCELIGLRSTPALRAVDYDELANEHAIDPRWDERMWTEM